MHALIAKVGKGHRGSKDLTWEEAKQAMRLLIEQQATPVQAGAFLLAMRLKGESIGELAAFTSAAREYVPALPVPAGVRLVDLPWYLEKRETVHAVVAASLVAAAGGAAVLLHGHADDGRRDGPDAPDGRGSLVSVLSGLGIPVDWDGAAVARALGAVGFAFLDMAAYHPPVGRFLGLRHQLGLRHLFHAVATLLNPGRAGVQVIGVPYATHFEKTAEALKMLRLPHALVIRGVEGTSELSIAAGTKILELRGERVTPLVLQARHVGLPPAEDRTMARPTPWRPVREAELLARLLANQVRGGLRDWVLLNAAMLLYASGTKPSIPASLHVARHALESGAAARKLEALRTFEVSGGVQEPSAATHHHGSSGDVLGSDPAPTEAVTR